MSILNESVDKWNTGDNPIVLTKQNGTIVQLQTNEKYVNKNIELTVNAQGATPTFNGGAISGTATNTFTNISTTSSDISGVKVVASATASRTAILYKAKVDGWVTKAKNATAVSALNNQELTPETTYINGVNIINSKNFNITVPNGAATITFNFAVDANGNVLVT